MELVYLWVEDYKNIHEQGFNFSPRFECTFHNEYDEEGKLNNNSKLEIKPKEHIKNFFDKKGKINLTAIVGENGSGKSAILEILTSSLSESSEKHEIFPTDKSKFFLIYEYGGNYYSLKVNLLSSLKIIDEKYIITDIEPKRLFSKHKDLIAILLNNESIVKKNYVENVEQLFVVNTQYHINNIQKTIVSNYIEERNKSFSKDIDKFFIPTKIKIQSKYSHKINKQITSSLKNFSVKEAKENIQLLEDAFRESSNNLLEGINKNSTSLLHTFELKKLSNEKLEKIFSLKSKLIDIEISNDTKSFKDLSYGERQLLTNLNFILFYSKQNEYETREKSYDEDKSSYMTKTNNILILIDEFELGLHPNWQKKSIKYIIDFLKNIDKRFHLVITSHSPFILSDLVKENVIFLKDGKEVKGIEKQTFGANIHTLLSDSFFMDGGLMGEFAKNKIEEVVNFLHVPQREGEINNHEEASQIIEIIGEPILKMKLRKMLENYKKKNNLESEEDIKKQIEELQRKLEEKQNHD